MRPSKQCVQHLPMKHKGQGAHRGNKARANQLTTQVRASRRIRTPLLGLEVRIYLRQLDASAYMMIQLKYFLMTRLN